MRVKNCLETVGRQFLPRDIKMSRRALWVLNKEYLAEPWTVGSFRRFSHQRSLVLLLLNRTHLFSRALSLGDRKSLSIAKNHPKPSQEFSEQFGPSIHKIKGFGRNSPQKVHPNFAQKLGRQILGNTFSGLNFPCLSPLLATQRTPPY